MRLFVKKGYRIKIYIYILRIQEVVTIYIVSYYIKWITTSWTHSTYKFTYIDHLAFFLCFALEPYPTHGAQN